MDQACFEVTVGDIVRVGRDCDSCGECRDDHPLYRLKYAPKRNTLSDYRDVVFCETCWIRIQMAFKGLMDNLRAEKSSHETMAGRIGESIQRVAETWPVLSGILPVDDTPL